MHPFVLCIIWPRHEHGCLSEDIFGRECQAKRRHFVFLSHIFGVQPIWPWKIFHFFEGRFLLTCLFRLVQILLKEDSGAGNRLIESPQYTWILRSTAHPEYNRHHQEYEPLFSRGFLWTLTCICKCYWLGGRSKLYLSFYTTAYIYIFFFFSTTSLNCSSTTPRILPGYTVYETPIYGYLIGPMVSVNVKEWLLHSLHSSSNGWLVVNIIALLLCAIPNERWPFSWSGVPKIALNHQHLSTDQPWVNKSKM